MKSINDHTLYIGDCLNVLAGFPSGSIHCVYLDPPFYTQKTHRLITRDRRTQYSFEDSWASEEEYRRFLECRLTEVIRVLRDDGALFFHCDKNASHMIRMLLDRLLGSTMFRSEIIWSYRRWSNSRRGLLPAHQTILYYTKSEHFTFNTIREDYSPTTNVDQIMQQRSRDGFGKSVYKRGQTNRMAGNGLKKGVPLSDVWDLPYLNPKARERTGYPTQKPVHLLTRIVEIATDVGDVVLDPFCGSGTTLVAANLLDRRSIGIDISSDAIELARERLAMPTLSESRMMRIGREAYWNADKDALGVLYGASSVPVHRNAGIDAFVTIDGHDKPVAVRVQRTGETILHCAEKLYRATRTKDIDISVVVATHRGGHLTSGNDLPEGVVVVDAPALSISDHVRLQMEAAPS